MFVSLLALSFGAPSSAQEAPEPLDHDYAEFHLDRRGNVVAMEACDRYGCWSVDLTEATVTPRPRGDGFVLTDAHGVSEYWDCWEDEEQLMSICIWKTWTVYGPGCNPEHCA